MFVNQNQQKSVWNLTLLKSKHFELFLNMSLPIMLGIIFISSWVELNTYPLATWVAMSYLMALGIYEFSYYLILKFLLGVSILSIEITAFGGVYKCSKENYIQKRQAFLGAIFILAVSCLLTGYLAKAFQELTLALNLWSNLALLLLVINLLPLYPTKAYLTLEAKLLTQNQLDSLSNYNKLAQYFILLCLFLSLQYGNLLIITIVVLFSIFGVSRIQKNKIIAEFSRYQINDVIIPKERLVCFSALMTTRAAVYLAVNSFQDFFPVLQERKFIGLVSKSQLIKNIALAEDGYLRAMLDRQQITVRTDQKLEAIAQIFLASNLTVIPVLDLDDNFIGLIVKDKVSEFDLIKNIEEHNRKENESEI